MCVRHASNFLITVELGDVALVPAESTGRHLLGNIGVLSQTTFIIVVISSFLCFLLLVALVLLAIFIFRSPSPSVSPLKDPNVLQEAANQVAQAAAAQLAEQRKLPAPSSSQDKVVEGAQQQLDLYSQEDDVNFKLKQLQLEPQDQHPVPVAYSSSQHQNSGAVTMVSPQPAVSSNSRGPAIEASSLVQRLLMSGQPEAAMAVASAAGINPATVVGSNYYSNSSRLPPISYGMPAGALMPYSGQRIMASSHRDVEPPMQPYAPAHALIS
ncbi:hypothetical protein CEUSTIGMA_g6070.t1 [Chlamydomonas eustigma]|uniref:Uncharacterized protein n=1 Tax=Chlamydomonas eustigma TaxID=1157962 RepID=A0A250X6W9_9CHLO|nr:hypothetical protein CEUSTIGMA_g6070.t1 [Chlamydomonas eustigma]|eukprot:GAX78632.1 hypothetical protein CEUSTIGMA_g6070.t1 [Chlamydomonas eustigma]